jgi:hypothetical protein
MLAAHSTAALPLQLRAEKLESLRDGGHSSMVEPQIVVLAVAGSSPVGHPPRRLGTGVETATGVVFSMAVQAARQEGRGDGGLASVGGASPLGHY